MFVDSSLRSRILATATLVVPLLCAASLGQDIQTSSAQFRLPQPVLEANAAGRSRTISRVNQNVGGGIVGAIDPNGFIVVSGDGQPVSGLDFASEAGLLRPIPTLPGANGPSADPFEAVLANTPNRITLGNPRSPLSLQGTQTLGAGYVGDSPDTDLTAVWGQVVGPVVTEIPFPVVPAGSADYSPFNLTDDGRPIQFAEAVFLATIEAGSASGVPPDSPAARVDPNIGGQFPGVGSLEIVHPTLGTFICTGSVIDDTHVLTAAHCFDYDDDGALDAGLTASSSFHLNDGGSPSSTTAISTVTIHPDFGGFATTGASDDLAIVTLASSVPAGTTEYPVRAMGMAMNEAIELVGHGISGFGDVAGDEVSPSFSVKRSGKNEADLFIIDDEGSGLDELFLYDFDGPTGTGSLGGATLGNDIETTVRGGDSGGPALVLVAGQPAIAGVNTFEFVLTGSSPSAGEFGALGGGVLIDVPQFAWIASVAPGVTEATPEPSTGLLSLAGLTALAAMRRRGCKPVVPLH